MRAIYKVLLAAMAGAIVFIGPYGVGQYGSGQSLGDVAREQRQKAKDAKAAPKVFTNEDLPKHDPAYDTSGAAHPDARSGEAHEMDGLKKSAREWQLEIQGQKMAIASQQAEIDRLSASVHYVEANRYRGGLEHNERELRKQEEIEHMQRQLEEEKRRLEEMQEGARHDGYGNGVYDP
jgi:hypothetical protein